MWKIKDNFEARKQQKCVKRQCKLLNINNLRVSFSVTLEGGLI